MLASEGSYDRCEAMLASEAPWSSSARRQQTGGRVRPPALANWRARQPSLPSPSEGGARCQPPRPSVPPSRPLSPHTPTSRRHPPRGPAAAHGLLRERRRQGGGAAGRGRRPQHQGEARAGGGGMQLAAVRPAVLGVGTACGHRLSLLLGGPDVGPVGGRGCARAVGQLVAARCVPLCAGALMSCAARPVLPGRAKHLLPLKQGQAAGSAPTKTQRRQPACPSANRPWSAAPAHLHTALGRQRLPTRVERSAAAAACAPRRTWTGAAPWSWPPRTR